jgi:phosphatidate phosphatase PAH1
MKIKLLEHNKQNKTYTVLIDDNGKLYLVSRLEDGTLTQRKAWYENNELVSKDWTTSYETDEEYEEKAKGF